MHSYNPKKIKERLYTQKRETELVKRETPKEREKTAVSVHIRDVAK